MKGIKGTFQKLGLVTDDSPLAAPAQSNPSAPQQPQYVPPVMAPSPSISTANADSGMVAKIKALVVGSSPIVNKFLTNLELVEPQFPNDHAAAVRAAIAFTQINKAALQQELNSTVAAALLHAKQSTDNDRQRARDGAVSDLEKQLSDLKNLIKEWEAQVVSLQQSITAKQGEASQIQGKIQEVEAQLRQQDDTVSASFAQVDAYLKQLGQTL